MISIIVAIAENYAIGKNNDLLWHIPEDLKRFKKITSGHRVIMGKKTWFSLPVRPLPGRENIIITDDRTDAFEGCTMVYSLDEAINHCREDQESFVIGGASVYSQLLPRADRLYITWVHKEFEGDVFFPEISDDHWKIISREDVPFMEPPGFAWSYVIYDRK